MSREESFNRVIEAYNREDSSEEQRRGNVLKDTSLGFFVPSNMRKTYEFFRNIRLEKYRSFIDLGSGDGRIVLIASLFTRAAGIESDEKLHEKALRMREKLGIPDEQAELIRGDFMKQDIRPYDAVYMYPDKPIPEELNKKLNRELKGDLLLHTDSFKPEGMRIRTICLDWLKFCICKNI